MVHSMDSPSVFVSWAHRDPGWTEERTDGWREEVLAFVTVLRSLGVDVDIDLFHLHDRRVDWTRWGPAQVQAADIVLGVVSPAWRARLEGSNAPTEGAGAVAEADVLLGTFGRDQDQLRNKLVLVVLPSMRDEEAIPERFQGIARVELSDLAASSVTPLLHLVLDVPVHELPPLGRLPDLVPLTPRSGAAPASDEVRGDTEPNAKEQVRQLEERIGVLRQTLSRMPQPGPGEGPHLPWYRAWMQVRGQLADLEQEREDLVRSAQNPLTGESPQEPVRPGRAIGSGVAAARTPRATLDLAARTPGGPDHWMLYEGMLLLHVVVAPAPFDIRHPAASNPQGELEAAVRRGAQVAAAWPDGVSLVLGRLQRGWTAAAPHVWQGGRSSTDPGSLASRPTAAASFSTQTCVLTVDRTWPTAIVDDRGRLLYHAAREAEVLAELLITLRIAASLLHSAGGVAAADLAVVIGAAPSGRLVSSERAVAGGRFGEPHDGIRPVAEVPSHFTDGGTFALDDLRDPYRAARGVLGPWLATFRGDDLLARLRDE